LSAAETYPKISVITPNFNQCAFIERTITSVLDQNYPNLEYIIIDGRSTDTSVEIIKKFDDELFYWESEKDEGMYHAINKGFARSTGAIMCWINSDDVLWEGALHFVARVFTENKQVQWLQGFPSVIDENDNVILQRDPVASKYYFYLRKHEKEFSFVQQESTFWTRELWNKSGGALNVNYELAADFDLWLRFFGHEELYCTQRQLAAFRKREGQKSSDMHLYLSESKASVRNAVKRLNFLDKLKLRIARLTGSSFLNKPIKWI